jgi:hypothetical protein
MVEVQCCKRDELQSFFIFSPALFIHSDCLLACLLIACRFSTSLSPRCSDFASAIHNIHAVSHNVFHLFLCRRSFVFTSSHLPMCLKEVHSGRHNKSTCLNSIPPFRLHFQRWPSVSFIPPTPLPTLITLRSPTPMSSIMIFFSSSSLEHHAALYAFPLDDMVTFTAAMLQTRQTAVPLHLLSSLVHSL